MKFRTMREAGPAGDPTWGRDNASRVTRLGAVYYIKHMSVLFDLQILFDTVKFVLSGKRPG